MKAIPTALLPFILASGLAFAKPLFPEVNGIRLGMNAARVISILGKGYRMIDTIGKSVVPGQDYGLVYPTTDGDLELAFTYGRVTYISGYRLTTPSGSKLIKGDTTEKMRMLLGAARDIGGSGNTRSFKYLLGKVNLIISTQEGRIDEFSIE